MSPCFSRTKNQPKEEVFGPDIPRTSGGHSRGCPGPKLRSGRSKSWKNKHLGADIHDPKARTSTTLRDFQKLRSEKLWAEFSFPSFPTSEDLSAKIIVKISFAHAKFVRKVLMLLGFRLFPWYTRSMRAASCELWQSLAKFGELW